MRLREPVDVLAAIPYVVGYQPTDSVVVLAMRARRLVFTARDDLPPVGVAPRVVAETVMPLLDVVLRRNASAVLLVGFGAEERVLPVLAGLREACEVAGLGILEVLRATDGRYWSYLCDDPACCPPEGSPYDVNASPVPAEATLAGCVAMPDRETYEAQIRPLGGLSQISVGQAAVRAGDRLLDLVSRSADDRSGRRSLLAAGRAAIDDAGDRQRAGGRLDDDEVAWLTVLLASLSVRDIAWGKIKGTPQVLETHRALWMDVMRRADPEFVAAPGSLFAYAAWRCGDATLARLALERVLAGKPDYAMARLLDNALAHGLPPWALTDFPDTPVRRRSSRRRRRRSSSSREEIRPA